MMSKLEFAALAECTRLLDVVLTGSWATRVQDCEVVEAPHKDEEGRSVVYVNLRTTKLSDIGRSLFDYPDETNRPCFQMKCTFSGSHEAGYVLETWCVKEEESNWYAEAVLDGLTRKHLLLFLGHRDDEHYRDGTRYSHTVSQLYK